jgi:hypothetical protein
MVASSNPYYYVLALAAFVAFVLVWLFYRKSAIVSFYLSVGFFIALGIVLLYIQVPYLKEDFTRALGHAFIIAAILAATVDHYVKERVLREVSLDVSKYLVGYRLPEEVQDRIRELMQSKWIRRKFEIRIAFAELSNGKKIKADIRISEEIQNITSEHLPYQDKIAFEKHEPVKLLELKCDCDEEGYAYHLEGECLQKMTTESAGLITSKGKEVKIPPAAQSIGRSYRFGVRYEVIQPTTFSEFISFNTPTIGVSVEITDAPQGCQFHLTPVADRVSHRRWEYKRLFAPGEHVRIIWVRDGNQVKK